MLLEIIAALIVGVAAGIFTGITPGIHVNLVSALLLSVSPALLPLVGPFVLAVFIVSMAVTHTFLDTLPSIYLGAPDADEVLNVLPGHRLLLEGKGHTAVLITVVGAFFSMIVVVIAIPLILVWIVPAYSLVQPFIGYALLAIVVYMLAKEKNIRAMLWSAGVFALSGSLGLIIFSMHALGQPLFHLLSGLFGVSGLLLSLQQQVAIPRQHFHPEIPLSPIHTTKAVGAAVSLGSAAGLLPGLGASHVAVLGMQLVGSIGEHGFMMLVGGIGTVNFVFSLAAFYTIEKARNGAIAVVLELLQTISLPELAALLGVCLTAGGIAAWITLKLSLVFSRFLPKINYPALCWGIIGMIFSMSLFFDGVAGISILLVSAAIGMIAPLVGVQRSMAMGCLLAPVILYFI